MYRRSWFRLIFNPEVRHGKESFLRNTKVFDPKFCFVLFFTTLSPITTGKHFTLDVNVRSYKQTLIIFYFLLTPSDIIINLVLLSLPIVNKSYMLFGVQHRSRKV